jgi:hypothetical protein
MQWRMVRILVKWEVQVGKVGLPLPAKSRPNSNGPLNSAGRAHFRTRTSQKPNPILLFL